MSFRRALVAVVRMVVFLALILATGTSPVGRHNAYGQGPDFRARFLGEYRAHATKIQGFYTNVALQFTTTRERGKGRKLVYRGIAKFNVENYLLDGYSENVQMGSSKKGPRQIEGQNNRYGFSLKEKGNFGLIIHQVDKRNQDKPTPLSFLSFPVADYRYTGKNFLDLANDSSVQITEFSSCTWLDRPAKKLVVKMDVQSGQTEKTVNMLISFFFSPADGWICVGMRAPSAKSPGVLREEVYHYEYDGQAFPIPKRMDEQVIEAGKVIEATRGVTEFAEFKHSSFSDGDFTLTAFGLPEPPGFAPPPMSSRWYLWFIAIAAVSLIVGIYLLRRSGRLDTATPASGS